jgi:peptide/nickel transport system permease protein
MRSRPRRAAILWKSLRRDRAAVVGLAFVSLWLIMAVIGPLSAGAKPNQQDLGRSLLPPGGGRDALSPGAENARAWLGTDQLGRDIAARILLGARTSMVIAFQVVAIAAVLGSLVGVLAAEARGWADEALMRLVDIQLGVPAILLAITLLAMIGASISNLVIVLVLPSWVIFARVVRSEVLRLRELEFVQAARALGATRSRIVIRHLLINVTGLIVVVGTLELSSIIIFESALSFLGLGVRPPDVSWGAMLADGRELLTVAWWPATLPGLAITLTVMGVNLLGDWLRDALDPRAGSRRGA